MAMRADVPSAALIAGFSNEPSGTHTSRTIMLSELQALLGAAVRDATYRDYTTAIVDENLLAKLTRATRAKSLRHLRELYALRSDVPIFASLRALWLADAGARPLLALLCAAARDPLLRSTAEDVLEASPGTTLTAPAFSEAVERSFPGRFTPGVLARIGRNVASSWTQSGYLRGRTSKVRCLVHPTPAAVAYALDLGHLQGDTGTALFHTLWVRLLDMSNADARELAGAAARLGWVGYRASAGMTEVTFRHLDALSVPAVGQVQR